ncbi:MAG: ribbon-helix-helix protein, CopG family [Synechococcaceae bacterium WB8_1B_136]|nr:ribbon-helix-helix protein, CopG family [Synechococcaceae bacterium WB8_1B_136]
MQALVAEIHGLLQLLRIDAARAAREATPPDRYRASDMTTRRSYTLYDVMASGLSVMAALSLRLSDELERKLSQEANLSGQPRSQLIREALETLLAQRERQRAEVALITAARVLADDPAARQEALAVSADFLAAENEALARVEAAEVHTAGEAQEAAWWR